MDENHIDAETEEKLKELAKADSEEFWEGVETAGIELTKEMLIEAAKKVHGAGYSQRSWDWIERRLKEICAGDSDEELSEGEKADDWITKYEKDLREYWAKVPTREAKQIGNGIYEVKLTAEEMSQDLVPVKLYLGDPTNVFDDNCKVRQEAQRELAETPLVYQKEFFGFLLTVTKNSVGILIELHTSVKASAVFGLCCRFLTGLGVPAAQIGGVEPIFSEWLPFPDAEL